MKAKLILASSIFLMTASAVGQVNASLLAKAFGLLGSSRIDAAILVPHSDVPQLVVLSARRTGESLSLFSLTDGKVTRTWYLAHLPDFMSVIDPANLHVSLTDHGPVITLHGCAAHLCGSNGIAGALVYDINQHDPYTAYASWSSSARTTKFVYSTNTAHGHEIQLKLLNEMLKDEGYNP